MKPAAPWWTVKCAVCGEELPERGNRRVYVPWKRGFRLVHADDCAGLIEAQGVLDITPPKVKPLSPVQVMRARARVKALLELGDPIKHAPEDLATIARLRVARLDQQLVRDEGPEELQRLRQDAVERLRRLLAHAAKSAGQPGRLFA